ncbi:MAG: hydroxylamine reductase, partial [Eubacterium sp.]|nr:hydroxylamine reductase [Eubacterium sp.]
MNCYQCQETMGGKGCRREGVCGKKADVAALQDLLVWTAGGLGALTTQLRKEKKEVPQAANRIFREALYVTMTNTNFDPAAIKDRISEVQSCCRELFP